MMSERSDLCQSPQEEHFNVLSHGVGAFISVVATGWMTWVALPLSSWHVISVIVFGVSLILLYTASSIYHWVTTPKWKAMFQILDHALIFVLIAGSYTPWLLVNLRGPWGWSLFGTVWGIAAVGICLKACFLPRFERLGTALYVVMGWLVVIAIKPLMASVNPAGMAWLVAGGVCYTAGVAFFLMKWRFAHFVWHVFVLGGSVCHIVAVFTGVLTAQ